MDAEISNQREGFRDLKAQSSVASVNRLFLEGDSAEQTESLAGALSGDGAFENSDRRKKQEYLSD